MKTPHCPTIIAFSVLLIFTPVTATAADKKQIVVDSVLATVDDRPITLFELGRRLNPPRKVTLQDVSGDPMMKNALDALILEHILLAEAERKNVSVGNDEIDQYINEVAARNNLTREAFEKALEKENRKLTEYKNQVKIDILKSKIAGSVIRTSAAVSDQEVEEYIKKNQSGATAPLEGKKVKLSQIVLSNEKHSEEEARTILTQIREEADDADSFAEAARKYSDSADAQDGGSLGEVAEKDLNPVIENATASLDDDEVSDIVTSPAGYHLFYVHSRTEAEEPKEVDAEEMPPVNDAVKAQIRQQLEREKLESKMGQYFTVELYKQHTVDKKI